MTQEQIKQIEEIDLLLEKAIKAKNAIFETDDLMGVEELMRIIERLIYFAKKEFE